MTSVRRRWLIRGFVIVLIAGCGVAGFLVPRYVPIGRGFDACAPLQQAARIESCIADRGRTYLASHSLPALARTVDEMSKQQWFYANCHQAMHAIVTPIGTRIGSRGGVLHSAGGNSTCAMGIAHGLMIGYLSSADESALRNFNITACPSSSSGSVNYETCVHSVGHTMYRKHVSLSASADICHRLAGAVAARLGSGDSEHTAGTRAYVECVGGIMMERTFADRSRAASCPTLGASSQHTAFVDACVSYLPINMAYTNVSAKVMAAACLKQSRTRAVLAYCASTYASVVARDSDCRFMKQAASICASVRSLNKTVVM